MEGHAHKPRQKPLESKKFIAMVLSATLTTLYTMTALIMMKFVPDVSGNIVNLVTMSLASLNGALSIYSLGQSAVDWKMQGNTTLTQNNTNEVKK